MTPRNQPATTGTPPRHETPEEQEVRLRAYELYEQRGRENGHDVDDWLQAEAEVSTQKHKGIAA